MFGSAAWAHIAPAYATTCPAHGAKGLIGSSPLRALMCVARRLLCSPAARLSLCAFKVGCFAHILSIHEHICLAQVTSAGANLFARTSVRHRHALRSIRSPLVRPSFGEMALRRAVLLARSQAAEAQPPSARALDASGVEAQADDDLVGCGFDSLGPGTTPPHRKTPPSSLDGEDHTSSEEPCSDDPKDSGGEVRRVPFLIRRLSEPPSPLGHARGDAFGATPFSSVMWWTDPLRNAVAKHAESLTLRRRIEMHSLCSGLATEAVAARALGLPIDCTNACELKEECRQFILRNFGQAVTTSGMSRVPGGAAMHIWRSMSEYVSGEGVCDVHGMHKAPQTRRKQEPTRCDIMVGGPPCQPFTTLRANRGSKLPENHRLYPAIFGDEFHGGDGSYLQCLRAKQPTVAILEEVPAFLHNKKNERSEYDKFVQEVLAIQRPNGEPLFQPGAIKCIRVNARTWLDLHRERLYLVMVSDAAGGPEGANDIVSIFRELHDYRSRFPAHTTFELLKHAPAQDRADDAEVGDPALDGVVGLAPPGPCIYDSTLSGDLERRVIES